MVFCSTTCIRLAKWSIKRSYDCCEVEMLFVTGAFSVSVSSVVAFLEDVPCNFLFTVLASAMAKVSAPETAKALMIFVANGFRFANVFLRSLWRCQMLFFGF